MVVLALGVSFVCPWSATWWSTMGYRAHARGQYDLAIEAYDTSLQFRPDQPWVMGEPDSCLSRLGGGERCSLTPDKTEEHLAL